MVDVELMKNTIDELSEKLENALEKGDFNEARSIVREIRRFFEGLLAKGESLLDGNIIIVGIYFSKNSTQSC